MQRKYLYEYAIIRVLPKVEREEFINVGVILYSREARFIKAIHKIDEEKLSFFPTELDIEDIRKTLEAFEKICTGGKENGSIATLDIPERFRWLTAPRSTCVQTSIPRTGFSSDVNQTLLLLFEELVL